MADLRPVRVGDIVRVGEVIGRISRINIRATTVTDFDRLEVVIPNKDFITSRLINWTLSDPTTRVVVPVGIAYGSDPEQAITVIGEAIADVEGIAKEPAPQIGIAAFGDSSINIDYRVWVPTQRYFELLHKVNMRIFRDLKTNGIAIPFPQREVTILQNPG